MTVRVTRDVGDAVAALRSDALVALPTETVYGLAGDATSPSAVAKIFATKSRPATHPVIVHLPDISFLPRWTDEIPAWAEALTAEVWPGPLTVIVPRGPDVLDAVCGGQRTVGLRVPAHPLTLRVLNEFGAGLAAPSANRYGQVSPTTAQHVVDGLGDSLDGSRDLVLDGGRCSVGVESTIVGAWDDTPRLLRAGAVTARQIAEITGRDVSTAADGVRAPGSTAAHYAPRARVVPVEAPDLDEATATLSSGFGLIALADVVPPDADHTRLASPRDDSDYARQLYTALRAADDARLGIVIAVLPPDTGVGHAVRDRLLRAGATSPATSPASGQDTGQDTP
ncbi:MAG: L-threonylcarbamoyladenylate synthase [Actinomycetes bacterium]